MSFRKILIAVDFSPHAEHALEVAADLAKRLGAAVGIVHVHEPVVWAPGLVEALDAKAGAALRSGLDGLLTEAATRARAAGVASVETRLIEGAPFVEIARCAQEGGYDLIVLGTHGRTGIGHALIGSVAERVVRKAHCPVLTVNLPSSTETTERQSDGRQ